MDTKKIFLLIALFLTFISYAEAHEKTWPEKRLRQIWPNAQNFESKQVTLTSAQNSEIQAEGLKVTSADRSPTFYLVKGKSSASEKSKTIGIIFFVDEAGDNGQMEITVAMGSDGQVKKVDLWESSENVLVKKDDFLKQFVGKIKTDSIVLGKDYQAVAEAPKASAAVARAVEKALKITNAVFEKKK